MIERSDWDRFIAEVLGARFTDLLASASSDAKTALADAVLAAVRGSSQWNRVVDAATRSVAAMAEKEVRAREPEIRREIAETFAREWPAQATRIAAEATKQAIYDLGQAMSRGIYEAAR